MSAVQTIICLLSNSKKEFFLCLLLLSFQLWHAFLTHLHLVIPSWKRPFFFWFIGPFDVTLTDVEADYILYQCFIPRSFQHQSRSMGSPSICIFCCSISTEVYIWWYNSSWSFSLFALQDHNITESRNWIWRFLSEKLLFIFDTFMLPITFNFSTDSFSHPHYF